MMTQRLRPTVLMPAAFTVAYTLAAAVVAVVTGNGEFVFYVAVLAGLIAIVTAVHWRVNFSAPVLWALAVWGGMHMAGGLMPVPESWPINGDIRVLYSWWLIHDGDTGYLKYDHVVHAFGFAVTAWLCWEALQGAIGKRRPTVGLMTLCATASLGFGATNEVVEFIATKLGPTNVGGYDNTGYDLVANTVGAIVAVTAIYVAQRKRPSAAAETPTRT